MSRIGKQPIAVPAGVEVSIAGRTVSVKGPRGALTHELASPITASVDGGVVTVSRPDDERRSRSLHGLSRTLIANMIEGVVSGYRKDLEIVGTGYRVQQRGSNLEFSLGFSHTVPFDAPAGIELKVDAPTKFSVSGADKQLVGEVAAKIRQLKLPEPYKGKGIRYAGENVRRKVGKAGK